MAKRRRSLEVDENEMARKEEVFGIFMRDPKGRVWMFSQRERIIPEDEP